MHIDKRIIGVTAAAALSIAALAGTGTAFAAGSSATPAGVHQSSTSTHAKSAVDTPDAPEAPGSSTSVDTDNVQQGDQQSLDTGSSTEKADSETGPSDGPGGHADGPGNVDHQFNGNE